MAVPPSAQQIIPKSDRLLEVRVQIEGRLRIEIGPGPPGRRPVSIVSSRPLQAARILEGRTPDEVLSTVALLFSVCGTAQAQAAARALGGALGRLGDAATERARELLVVLETAREHLWRILLDWPVLMDETVEGREAAPLGTWIGEAREALFGDAQAFALEARVRPRPAGLADLLGRVEETIAQAALGMASRDWLAMRGADELAAWARRVDTPAARLLRYVEENGWEALGDCDVAPLPLLEPGRLADRLLRGDAGEFIARPEWQGSAWDNTPLARQIGHPLVCALRERYGNGLLTRLAARLVELAGLPEALRRLAGSDGSVQSDGQVAPGRGLGLVEAARGRLVHGVEVENGRVSRYRILAPTEWNFHPRGLVMRGLAGLPAGDAETLRRQASLLIHAVDPCVGHDLEIR